MSEGSEGAAGSGPSHRTVELGVAVFMAIFAAIVIGGSLSVGVDWGPDGPRPGFFPFYVGLFILGASAINFVQAWRGSTKSGLFAEWGQLRQVMSVVVPASVYVAVIPWIGMYVASALLIGLFMKWLGRYGWTVVLPIAIGMPLVTFIVFERWFLVSLPKGPLEAMLGF